MMFAIKKNSEFVSFDEIDSLVSKFWDTPGTEYKYVSPIGYSMPGNDWHEVIGYLVAKQRIGEVSPYKIIGAMASIASISEPNYECILTSLKWYKPYIDLVLELDRLGYTFISIEG